MKNKVFIATSIDGYIADKNGNIDWLHSIPNPHGIDMGYSEFMSQIDALIMGRKTFETVCGFDIDWPYTKPVFVLSNTLKSIPDKFVGKAEIIKGDLSAILNNISKRGFANLYIDGGSTIQSFLKANLIDEMIITTIPILLGGGISLFGDLEKEIKFKCISTEIFLESVVQNHFIKIGA